MSLNFKIDSPVKPSGVNLAFVDIPPVNPAQNMSIIDRSYQWEENVANVDAGIIRSAVGQDGYMPKMTITEFVVTNITTDSRPDMPAQPLYYSHICRFRHYSYGDNPAKHVYLTDGGNRILKNVNYKVIAQRESKNLFKIQVVTDFKNNESIQYRVRYNRSNEDGTVVIPSWSEILNAQPLFNEGSPSVNRYDYALIGPDLSGLYRVRVPSVPNITELKNSLGVSFDLSPTFIIGDPLNTISQTADVDYTLKAIGTTTFTVSRNVTPSGSSTTDIYLQGATGNIWGENPVSFDIGSTLRFGGTSVMVSADNYLNTGDQAFFTASRPYYYLMPIKFKAIYLEKPYNMGADDDWFVKIKAGSFRRRMEPDGTPVPSGQGTLYQYYVSEYDENPWSLEKGRPYIEILSEDTIPEDSNTIRVRNVPLYIPPSDVYYNDGFPSSGFIHVHVNDEQLPETDILDWDVQSGRVETARTLKITDDVRTSYHYREDYYEYQGFYGSGKMFPDSGPFSWYPLELNPTPMHNQGMYASGVSAHIFMGPSWDLDNEVFFDHYPVYHNYTGDPSGSLDFYLGSVSLAPHIKEKDITIIDTRTRGGGLRDSVDRDDVSKVQPETEFFWDMGYFDGQAFPSNGVLVVQLPKALQGREDEVREKVNKHLAFGQYVVIDYI